ncbi:glycoside hydrolase family 95 protein [Paenibacillus rhizovicinus]|uniref:Glycoside hydrolase family 95 protein n=1 Tax=Paenibacillus rhizovicinus TaxID=2704463 RepID=A0A6C0P0V4_9BACL|nr:glycoside hydrolase family 95 protein [Paenibacillus rhizovicinus]QHW31856.1 glycoside hydrolase family 95 protein [Paenibacillus rhizovicinus]
MSDMKLSYNRPALEWKQGLPLGNGRLGAVVQSGTDSETWFITEVTYWSGKSETSATASRGQEDLAAMRELFYAGDYEGGEEMAGRLLQAEKGNFGTNLSLCDVRLTFGDGSGSSGEQSGAAAGTDGAAVSSTAISAASSNASSAASSNASAANYDSFARELDLEEALHRVAYTQSGVAVSRETLASHPDNVLASRIRSGQPGGVSFTLRLEGRTDRFAVRAAGNDALAFEGQATETMHSDGTCGVKSAGAVKVAASGGTVTAEGAEIVVSGADEAWIYFAVDTDYGREDDAWRQAAASLAEQAAAKGYAGIREAHIADYRTLFARVEADFGVSGAAGLPLDERMRLLREGGSDPGLFALFFQYGRYLTIAGSRADSRLPLHLQGIWNDGEANRMAWSCDYHLDVNTEMNYYPTETTNLAECHEPLMRYIEGLAEAGRATARDYYGCEGWAAHVFSNAWGFTAPGWHYSWGLNVTGGLWIAHQLREHYEYGRDEEFLKTTAYPVLKEAALFYLDYMTVHPQHGWLVTGPSNSPENSFYLGDNTDRAYALSMGSTMDQSLIRDLFVFCLEAGERLNVDEPLRERIREAIGLLPPLQVGADGKLQEWLEDYAEAQPDHRHLSHLYGLYPGTQITPQDTPELSEAARVTLISRMRGEGLEDVEFTLALFAANFARLHDGDRAYDQLSYLISELCFDNLLTYSKAGIAGAETNIFVADGNFGGTAAVSEMLLQSRAGEIHLLPALPQAWHTGRITGLRAKGNAEVDLVWNGAKLDHAVIRASAPLQTRIRYGERLLPIMLEAGESCRFEYVSFSAAASQQR